MALVSNPNSLSSVRWLYLSSVSLQTSSVPRKTWKATQRMTLALDAKILWKL